MQIASKAGDDARERARSRLAAASYMASIIAHPVRNRLSSVRAILELLNAGLERNLTPEHRTIVLGEFNALIDDFNLGLDMVAGGGREVKAVSAREIANEAVNRLRPMGEAMGIAITTDLGRAEDRIRADRSLLRLAILNLLRNAIEALPGTQSARITVTMGSEDDQWWMEVADNGPGVPANLHDGLFLEEVTRGAGSAGLGLAICRDAMAVMEGSLRYMSPKGSPGARFRLTVPLDQTSP